MGTRHPMCRRGATPSLAGDRRSYRRETMADKGWPTGCRTNTDAY
jgi:hypothetical protein